MLYVLIEFVALKRIQTNLNVSYTSEPTCICENVFKMQSCYIHPDGQQKYEHRDQFFKKKMLALDEFKRSELSRTQAKQVILP